MTTEQAVSETTAKRMRKTNLDNNAIERVLAQTITPHICEFDRSKSANNEAIFMGRSVLSRYLYGQTNRFA